MPPRPTLNPATPLVLKITALLAVVFGVMTLRASGVVLFGPDSARAAVGAYVPFVVWFNLAAGVLYVITGLGIWQGCRWALWTAILLAASTAVTGLLFAAHIMANGAFEMRTVGAMILRTGFWVVISAVVWWQRRKTT